ITGLLGNFLRGDEGEGDIFQFDFLGTGSVGEYILITWTGTTNFNASDFSYVNLADGFSGEFLIDGNALLFTVIPEPSTYLLSFGALLLVVVMIRRKGR